MDLLAPLQPWFQYDLSLKLPYLVAPVLVLLGLAYLLPFISEKTRALGEIIQGLVAAFAFCVLAWVGISLVVQAEIINPWLFPGIVAVSFGGLLALALLRGNARRAAGFFPLLQSVLMLLAIAAAIGECVLLTGSHAKFGETLLPLFWVCGASTLMLVGLVRDRFGLNNPSITLVIVLLVVFYAMLAAVSVHWLATFYRGQAEYALPIAAIGVLLFLAVIQFVAKYMPAMWETTVVLRAIATAFLAGVALLAVFHYGSFSLPLSALGILLILLGIGVFVKKNTTMEGKSLLVRLTAFALLAGLGGYVMFNSVNAGAQRYNSYLNAYEFYHYYIGTKYAPEVGYTNMYNATIVADNATGLQYKKSGNDVRDLSTGGRISYDDILKIGDKYGPKPEGLFTETRWQEFLADTRWFKKELVASRWSGMLGDKGYNGTPMWSMVVGGLFSNNIPTSSEWGMFFLALLDPILLFLAFLAVWWAFGIRASLLLTVLVGTSYVMHFSHMKGAYLRTDFAMSLVLSICMIRKNHYGWAGMFAAYSFCSRVFPAIFFFGLGAKLLWHTFPVIFPAVRAYFRKFGVAGVLLIETLTTVLAVLVMFLAVQFLHNKGVLPIPPASREALKYYALGLVALGLVATVSYTMIWGWITGRLPRRYLAFFASATVTVLLLVGGSVVYFWGAELHPDDKRVAPGENATLFAKLGYGIMNNVQLHEEYAQKIGKHNEDISPWRVGYKYLFISVFPKTAETSTTDITSQVKEQSLGETLATSLIGRWPYRWFQDQVQNRDPGVTATAAFKKALMENQPFTRSIIYKDAENNLKYKKILLLVLALGFFAVFALKDSEAMAWSFVPVFFMVAPTYYYYIMLVVPMLFFAPYTSRPSRMVGAILLLLIAMPGYWFYGPAGWRQQYGTYFYHSLMIMGVVLYMMLCALGDSFFLCLKRVWQEFRAARRRRRRNVRQPQPVVKTTAV